MLVEPFGIPETRTFDLTVSKVPDVGLKDRLGTAAYLSTRVFGASDFQGLFN